MVYGRIAGENAGKYIKSDYKDGRLSLNHVVEYNKQVESEGVSDGRVSPMILPDYTDPAIREKQLTSHYVGTLR